MGRKRFHNSDKSSEFHGSAAQEKWFGESPQKASIIHMLIDTSEKRVNNKEYPTFCRVAEKNRSFFNTIQNEFAQIKDK